MAGTASKERAQSSNYFLVAEGLAAGGGVTVTVVVVVTVGMVTVIEYGGSLLMRSIKPANAAHMTTSIRINRSNILSRGSECHQLLAAVETFEGVRSPARFGVVTGTSVRSQRGR